MLQMKFASCEWVSGLMKFAAVGRGLRLGFVVIAIGKRYSKFFLACDALQAETGSLHGN